MECQQHDPRHEQPSDSYLADERPPPGPRRTHTRAPEQSRVPSLWRKQVLSAIMQVRQD